MADGTEYLTGNRHIRYPFADDLHLSDAADHYVFGCFVDAQIQFKSPYATTVPVLGNIGTSGNALSFTLYGVSGCDPIVLSCTASGTHFPVVHGESDWCWYTFVLSSDGIRELIENRTTVGILSTVTLPFSTRCVGRPAAFLSSILVYDGLQVNPSTGARYTRQDALLSAPFTEVSGDVAFVEGNNMSFGSGSREWSLEMDDGVLKLNATPGGGTGRIACSDPEEETFKMPGLVSGDGHARIFNDTCYDVVPYVFREDGELVGELHVQAKCTACCTCDMYASIVNDRLVPLRDSILSDKASLERTLATYEENVARWNERVTHAYPEDIIVTSTAVALDAAATDLASADVAGRMDRCGFSVVLRNDSFVDVTFKMTRFSANGEPFEAQLGYMNGTDEPVILPVDLTQKTPPIFSVVLSPGRSATLGFFVRLKRLVKTDHQSGFIARTTFEAYQGTRLVTTVSEETRV